ncbi:hypothetical protein [Spiroplasma endosymbiont of Nomada rufipes]
MKFLYENFLQFYLLALTSIIQHKKFLTILKNVQKIDIFNKNKFIQIF